MRKEEIAETIAEMRRVGGVGVPLLSGAILVDPRMSPSASDCMVIGISGGCGLLCPVLHAGRCETADDFREDALQVLQALQASCPASSEA